MARGNRKIFVASFLIAIPFVVLMTTISIGENSAVQHAIVHSIGEGPVIQQVVGKQVTAKRSSRTGSLWRTLGLAGEQESPKPQSRPAPQPKQASTGSQGILSGLFSRWGDDKPSSDRETTSSGNSSPESVDWRGIPYHAATRNSPTQTGVPIRDPGVRSQQARVSQGRVPEPLPSSAFSTNHRAAAPRPTLARPSVPVNRPLPSSNPVARTPAPITANTASTVTPQIARPELSSETSSRRSGRRIIHPLDPSQVASSGDSINKAASPSKATSAPTTAELVPRVARRIIATEETATEETATEETATEENTEPMLAATPAPTVAPTPITTSTLTQNADPKDTTDQTQVAESNATAIDDTYGKDQSVAAPTPSAELATTSSSRRRTSLKNETANTAQHELADTAQSDPMQAEASQSTGLRPEPSDALASNEADSVTNLPEPLSMEPIEDKSESSIAQQDQPVPLLAGPPASAFGPDEFVASERGKAINDSAPKQQDPETVGSGLASIMINQSDSDLDSADEPAVAELQAPSNDVAIEISKSPTNPPPMIAAKSVGGDESQDFGAQAALPLSPTFELPSEKTASLGTTIPARTVAHPMPNESTKESNRFPSMDSSAESFSRVDVPKATTRMLGQQQSSVASELPGIRVATYGPSEIMIRQSQQYEIRVENRGSIDAEGVLVRAVIPDWAEMHGHRVSNGDIQIVAPDSADDPGRELSMHHQERLVWTIDSLPSGSVERLFLQLSAERSGTFDLDVDWALTPRRAISTVTVHEPRLELTIAGPEEVVFGQSQAYTVRVLNPGNGTAPNVVFTLSPNSATPQTQRIGDIPPGKEAQFDIELTAQDLVDLTIHGLASGDLGLRAESEKTIRVAAAKLEAVLTGPDVKYQNTESLYHLELNNNGSASCERIAVSLQLPSGVNYLGGIEGATQNDGVLQWTIDALAPNAKADYEFRCEMVSGGDQKFILRASGTAAGQTTVALATRVEAIADLVLKISDPAAPAPIDQDVTYEIIVRNRGSKEATDVRVIAQFSHGIEPNRIDGHSGEVLTGQALFDTIPKIASQQEVRLKVIARAERAGHHRFRTEVHSGETILVAEEATQYMSPRADRVSRHSSDEQNR